MVLLGCVGLAFLLLAIAMIKGGAPAISPAQREVKLRSLLSEAVSRKLTFGQLSTLAEERGFKSRAVDDRELVKGTEIVFHGPENQFAAEEIVLRGAIFYRDRKPYKFEVFWTKTVFAL